MMISLSFHVVVTGYRFTDAKYYLGAGKAEEMILKFKIMELVLRLHFGGSSSMARSGSSLQARVCYIPLFLRSGFNRIHYVANGFGGVLD